jgi:transposase
MDVGTPTDTKETVMQGSAFAIVAAAAAPNFSLARSLRRRRAARRALERELADYATASDRDDLAALIAGRGVADSEAAAVLVRQVRRDLFRA